MIGGDSGFNLHVDRLLTDSRRSAGRVMDFTRMTFC
jgi:hypothetical protein